MFDIKIKKIESSAHENDGTFLQTPFWCEFKARHGWTYRRFEIEYTLPPLNAEEGCEKSKSTVAERSLSGALAERSRSIEGQRSTEVAVLNRSFAKGIFSIAYIPLFPKLPYGQNRRQQLL